MKTLRVLLIPVALLLGLAMADQQSNANHADYRSIQQKLVYLKLNAAKTHPDPKPVELTEAEVNAYFNEGGVKLPKGVSQVHLTSRPGIIDGHAHVDFEPIMQGRNPNNPLYNLFSGSHDIHVVAEAAGVNGIATIKTQTVELDNVAVPEWALEFFVQRYLTPRYPNVGMTSTFKMPLRIQTARIETGKVVLEQR
ncbi:MAG TPA: hypothetical protein VK976_08405 [Verrucomicrobiae bacterium]|jgi:hypothetical protein|nr:hypothetical protein [Verrucomicrobiae bacterium]